MTIQQTINIPANRRIHLDIDLPPDAPSGPAVLRLMVKTKTASREWCFPFIAWFGRREREAKRRAILNLAGCLKDNPVFGDNPVAYFRGERDAWDTGWAVNETKNPL